MLTRAATPSVERQLVDPCADTQVRMMTVTAGVSNLRDASADAQRWCIIIWRFIETR